MKVPDREALYYSRVEEATGILDEKVRENPPRQPSYYELAVCVRRLSRTVETEKAFAQVQVRRVLEKAPRSREARQLPDHVARNPEPSF